MFHSPVATTQVSRPMLLLLLLQEEWAMDIARPSAARCNTGLVI